jgi:hypothetical protein
MTLKSLTQIACETVKLEVKTSHSLTEANRLHILAALVIS